jgi:hypothetical protein
MPILRISVDKSFQKSQVGPQREIHVDIAARKLPFGHRGIRKSAFGRPELIVPGLKPIHSERTIGSADRRPIRTLARAMRDHLCARNR